MYIFPFIRIRYIKTITINTHIDCLNNSKCSVRDILLATKQGAFESVFRTFSVIPQTVVSDGGKELSEGMALKHAMNTTFSRSQSHIAHDKMLLK